MSILAKSVSLCVCTVLLFAAVTAAQDADVWEGADLAALEERMEDIASVAEDPVPFTGSEAMAKTLATCGQWLKYTLDYSPSLNAVTFSGSRWVVVGGGDDIYYSDDGLDWNWRDGGTNKYYGSVGWFNSRFVAVGEDGVIVTSSDGYSWTQAGSPTSEELRDLAMSTSRVVAVGRGGVVLWSADGQNWNVAQSPTTRSIFCVGFFAGRFRLIDDDGYVYDSVDGSVWIFRTTLPSFPEYGSMLGMGATSSTLVAVGYDVSLPSPGGGIIYTTTDGNTWHKLLPPCGTLRGVGFGAGKWVAVGDSTILESTNASSWEVVSSPLSGRIWDVAYGDDQFIAAGWEGILRQTCDPTPSCTYSISPTSANRGAGAGADSFSVSTQSGCTWTASSNSSWISITGGASGTGNGTVSYSFGPNLGSNPRTGTISAAGRTFTLTQSGTTTCNYSISPTSQSFGQSGGTASVSVTTTAGCTWTAVSHKVWYHITSGSSGNGSGSVSYSVDPNSGDSRTGTMTIAGHTFTVNQDAGGGGGTDYVYQAAGIAHAGGAGGSVWRSTLCITNRSGSTANLTLIYRTASNTVTRTRTLQNGRINEWEDVADSLFGQSNSTSGSIEITSNVPVMVVARTYNEGASGTFGQGMPGNDDSATLTSGQIGVLPQIKKTSSFRTNIGFMNHGSSACSVRVELFRDDGSQIGNTINTTVSASKWKQIDDVFGEAGVNQCAIGYATVRVTTQGGKVWAYASVVDNGTGDPTTIPLFIE